MPSRMIHDILHQILETSDVEMRHESQRTTRTSGDYFQNLYMGAFRPQLILRRVVRHSEIKNLPADVYTELLDLFQRMVRTGEPVNISRRFRDVRLSRAEMLPNPHSFEYDIRLEFVLSDLDEDHWRNELEEDSRYVPDWGDRRRSAQVQLDGQGRIHPRYFGESTGGIEPVYNTKHRYRAAWPDDVEIFGQKPVKKKQEKHFEDDLFEL